MSNCNVLFWKVSWGGKGTLIKYVFLVNNNLSINIDSLAVTNIICKILTRKTGYMIMRKLYPIFVTYVNPKLY